LLLFLTSLIFVSNQEEKREKEEVIEDGLSGSQEGKGGGVEGKGESAAKIVRPPLRRKEGGEGRRGKKWGRERCSSPLNFFFFSRKGGEERRSALKCAGNHVQCPLGVRREKRKKEKKKKGERQGPPRGSPTPSR